MQTYSTFNNRAFAAARRRLCNSLPSHLKQVEWIEFRRSLRHLCLDSGAMAQC